MGKDEQSNSEQDWLVPVQQWVTLSLAGQGTSQYLEWLMFKLLHFGSRARISVFI